MVRYFLKDTTIQLSVADLDGVRTEHPQNSQGPHIASSVQDANKEFSNGSKDGTLAEDPICVPTINLLPKDHKHYMESLPCATRFLGSNEDAYFVMVRAGPNFFDRGTSKHRNQRPNRVSALDNSEPDRKYIPPDKAHALCLTIFLSNKTFYDGEVRQKYGSLKSDLKIDVYLNGLICTSQFITHADAPENNRFTKHIVRISGQRVGRLLEEPWIFLPPTERQKGISSSRRWFAVSDALLNEANLAGRNEDGERSLLGDYLESVAALPLPEELLNSSGDFAIIDVVVAWGYGNKDSTSDPYLTKATRWKIAGCLPVLSTATVPKIPVAATNTLISSSSPISSPLKSTAISREPSKSTNGAISTPATEPSSPIQGIPALSFLRTERSRDFSLPRKTQEEGSSEPAPKRMRTRSNSDHNHMSTKLTRSEEFAFLTAQAAKDTMDRFPASPPRHILPRTTTASPDKRASSPLSELPATEGSSPVHTPEGTRILRLRLNLPRSGGTMGEQQHRVREKQKAKESMHIEEGDATFGPPELDKGGAVRYAGKDVVRNVPSVRGGTFKEGGIVMGARFVVG